MLRDEAHSIEEWLAFHVLQGVSRFVLYDNGSTDDGCARARRFARYVDVAIVPWPDTGYGFHHTQLRAFLNGTRRLVGTSDFVAYIDLDEFLYARDEGTLGAALAPFPAEVSAIAVNQRIFGASGLESSGEGLVTSRFTLAAPPGYPEAHYFKTVARPDRVKRFDSSHSAVLLRGIYALSDGRPMPPRREHPGYASVVADGAMRLHHYILKSREEFADKQLRWAMQDIHAKYDNAYFDARERSLRTTAVQESRLAAFAPRIRALIDAARGGA